MSENKVYIKNIETDRNCEIVNKECLFVRLTLTNKDCYNLLKINLSFL